MGSLTENVFLSYAEEDALTARRVYLDLERSKKLSVWGYKENGRIGANFRTEFEERIVNSRYFCLFDSPASRSSGWIKRECDLARSANATIAVCLLVKADNGDEWRRNELFESQNEIRGIDFTDYDSAIQQLCGFLQIVYSPGSTFPRDRDFEREVFNSGLDVVRAQELQNLYRSVREHFRDPEFAEALLRVVIKKCEAYGAKDVVSPVLALGVMHANAGRHRDALKTFSSLTKSHHKDPRGWSGLGGAYFHLGEYESCLNALECSHRQILDYYKEESADRIAEVVYNIASVQILLGRPEDAWNSINKLSPAARTQGYIRAVKGRLLLYAQEYRDALASLEAAYHASIEPSPTLIVDLADCYRRLRRHDDEFKLLQRAMSQLPDNPEICHRAAACFLSRQDIPAAISAMKVAAQNSENSPRYRAQFAALLCKAGRQQDGLNEARRCVELGAPTAQDHYYRGLAYYVIGRPDIAEYERAEANRDALIAGWPRYSETFDVPKSALRSRLARAVKATLQNNR